MTTSSMRSRLGLLDGGLVERPGLVDDLVADLDPHRRASCAPRRGSRARAPRATVSPRSSRSLSARKPDVPEVDAEQRRGAAAHELGRAQDRAVAAEHDDEFEVVRLDVRRAERTAPSRSGTYAMHVVALRRPGEHRGQRRPRCSCWHTSTAAVERALRPVCATTRKCRASAHASSRLLSVVGDPLDPFCRIRARGRAEPDEVLVIAGPPAIGEERTPAVPSPRSQAAQSTPMTASARRPASRTMPSRIPPRPTSNCGFTSSTKSASGRGLDERRQHGRRAR